MTFFIAADHNMKHRDIVQKVKKFILEKYEPKMNI